MFVTYLSFLGVGALAGILSGLLGIGGGIVTIPCLVLIFSKLHFPSAHLMHLAIGTSLAAMVFNTISGSYTHYKKKGICFELIKPMALGVLVGALLGTLIALLLPSHFLQLFFGLFEVLLGIRFLFPEGKGKMKGKIPKPFTLGCISTGVTTLSTMLGIGGGMVNVPILSSFGIPVKKAIGTSSALSFCISLSGAILFLIFGSGKTHYPETIGLIYIPAFILISIVSFALAPIGALLAHRLPTDLLKKVFAFVLIGAGFSMIL